jgi:hypothetical protein
LSPQTNILIINDGQDEVSLENISVPVHCFSLEELNYDLKDLCESSGGEYVLLYEPEDDED